jgi:hypothetical protein
MSNTLFEEYFKRKYNYLKDNLKAEEEKKISFCIEHIKILEKKIHDYEIKLNEINKLEYKINEITIEYERRTDMKTQLEENFPVVLCDMICDYLSSDLWNYLSKDSRLRNI